MDAPTTTIAFPGESSDFSGPTASDRRQVKLLVDELVSRKSESLRLYEALPHIEPFHACAAPERILRGSNRGGKAQPLDELVLTPNGWQEIGKLAVGDVVIGGDGLPCAVTGVFPQGLKEVFRLRFNGGQEARCCGEHLWKTIVGKDRFKQDRDWEVLSLHEIVARNGDGEPLCRAMVPTCIPWMPLRSVPLDPYLVGMLLGDGCMTSDVTFSSADEQLVASCAAAVPEGISLRKSKHYGKVRYDYHLTAGPDAGGQNAVTRACRNLGIYGCRSWEKFIPIDYLFNTKENRLAILQGLMDTDGTMDAKGHLSFSTTSPKLAEDVTFLVRSLGGRCNPGKWKRKKYQGGKRGRPSVRLHIHLTEVPPFQLQRKLDLWSEWRKTARTPPCLLVSVEPEGIHECVCISVSSADSTYTTSDLLVTHNTLSAAIEMARALTGTDPYNKFPKENGRLIVVGKDGNHNAEVLYRKLRRPGAFKIIRDKKTGLWRTFRPWLITDKAREKEAKDAPPLIPDRLVHEEAWDSKKENRITLLKMNNGWEAKFHSSLGKPPQGMDVDLAWFDEEIVDPQWYEEISARLIDRNGLFLWSATAQKGGLQLYELCQAAETMRNEDNPRVVEFFAHIDKNTFFTDEQRELFFEKLSDEQRQIRIEGEFAFTSFRVYPEFNKQLHGYDFFEIPDDWTRYAVIDPGRQVCAVLFAAVPPPTSKHEQCVYLYDELYIRKCDASLFGKEMSIKTKNKRFHAFLIDHQGSRVFDTGGGRSVELQYQEELRRFGVRSETTGHGFIWGNNDVKAGLDAARSWLVHRPDGPPRVKVCIEKCPNFGWEIERYHYKRDTSHQPTDDPIKKNDHLMDCFRYLAMHDVKWHPKKKPVKTRNPILDIMKRKKDKERRRNGDSFIALGPRT